jgi:hypothetical protein
VKFECTYCQNKEMDKFARTKRGPICLCCYEVSTREIPENEAEKAMVAIREHMTRPTGGNNRRWTNAYRALMNRADFLDNLPGKTPEQETYSKAFRDAIKVFDENAR